MRHRHLLPLLSLGPGLTACATVAGLRQAPLGHGDVIHFAARFDTAVAAAQRATGRVGLIVAESERVDSLTWRVLASRGLSGNLLLGLKYGEVVRVVVARVSSDVVAVRVVSRPRAALAVGGTDWTRPILQELERDLGRQALELVPGSRVRLSTAGQPDRVGTVVEMAPDTIVLEEAGPVALASLTRLDVRRGTRSHARAGVAIGGLLGAVVGAVIGQATEDPDCGQGFNFCFGALTGAAAGMLGGALIGGVLGSGVRTDQWWPVPLPRRP